MAELLKWRMYEVTGDTSSLNGVMLRGRIRKFGIEHGLNVLVENTEDKENGVRYAVMNANDGEQIGEYIRSIMFDAQVMLVGENVVNPVLSKLKVNLEDRYTI